MLHRAISLALVAVLLHGSVAAQAEPQSPPPTVAKMQQVLHKAQDKDKAVNITLARKIDNQAKLHGKVNEVSDTGFAVTDQKTGKITKLTYRDVQEITQRVSHWKLALVVVAVVVIAAIIVGYSVTGGD